MNGQSQFHFRRKSSGLHLPCKCQYSFLDNQFQSPTGPVPNRYHLTVLLLIRYSLPHDQEHLYWIYRPIFFLAPVHEEVEERLIVKVLVS
jgi:hypothetical protein